MDEELVSLFATHQDEVHLLYILNESIRYFSKTQIDEEVIE